MWNGNIWADNGPNSSGKILVKFRDAYLNQITTTKTIFIVLEI